MTAWRNWAGTATAEPRRVVQPRSENEIAGIVRDAATEGERVRVHGSGHSFTSIAATDSVAMDLSRWTGISSADPATGLVTVRAGTTLRALCAALDELGLAMSNLGDIDAQTIAGAISTGTHGTGARFGGLATQVEALELVLADGSTASCSSTRRSELFSAARVGLGALGVISAVTLRCEPSFVLAAHEGPVPLDAVLSGFDDAAATNDHIEFYWFPYGRNALVKRNNRRPAAGSASSRSFGSSGALASPESPVPSVPPTASRPPVSARPQVSPISPLRRFIDDTLIENMAFGALCRTGRALPRLVPAFGRMSAAALSTRAYSDVSHRVFTTRRAVRFVESEWAVPRESLREVLGELRSLVPRLRDPVAFPVEVRVAAADDIWLSTAYGRDTAYVAIHQYAGMPYRRYFREFAAIARSVDGRPHWGKMHDLDAAALRRVYPRFDDFLRVRADVDPAGVFGNDHLDRVLGPTPRQRP